MNTLKHFNYQRTLKVFSYSGNLRHCNTSNVYQQRKALLSLICKGKRSCTYEREHFNILLMYIRNLELTVELDPLPPELLSLTLYHFFSIKMTKTLNVITNLLELFKLWVNYFRTILSHQYVFYR